MGTMTGRLLGLFALAFGTVTAVADAATPARVMSVSPITLAAPGRGIDLQIRVSAPISGRKLPIILFSHGNGNSSEGYAPLVSYWAQHGFAVIQPTHLDSRLVALPAGDPRTARIWRYRVDDLRRVLDRLDIIEASVPGLKGRLDRDRIAVVGHSYGGITASMLLGARVIGASGRDGGDLSDPRVKAGVLLSTAGKGGQDLSPFAAEHFPFMNPDFSTMRAPVLVVAGDKDRSPLTVRGPDWFADPYALSPGPKCLLTMFGGEHLLGGISGYLVTETSDENPQRVAAVAELTTAYLRGALYQRDRIWAEARSRLAARPDRVGRIECK